MGLPASSLTRMQPLHVVYGGAHLFKAGTVPKLGELARKAAEEHRLAEALDLPEDVAAQVVVLASDTLSGHVTGEVVVVAGGMESMSRAPFLLRDARFGYRLGSGELVDALVHDAADSPRDRG